uniref:BZIP domain-containing protein n=1 Tax=Elaeophora elaphi TaxID=1147741 RepID=A0A0R3RR06_9BILA
MLVRHLFDTRTKLSNMSKNFESAESISNNDDYDGRYMNMKTFEGRNRLKTVTDGVLQPVDRQDSLMLCEQLQEQDGFDFMDQSMDLTPYLRDLRGIDDSSEDLEPIIDKQRVLEYDIRMQHGVCGTQYADLTSIAETIKSDSSLDDALVAVPETSGFAATFQPVKTETTSSEEMKAEREIRPTVSVKKDTSEQIEISFTPTIKPRKYSLKPEAEKKNPLYRLKREKNNDAVRRSRTKAKQQQKMKDEQIKLLQCQVTEFSKAVNIKDEQIVNLENAIYEVKEENRHLRVENMRLKSELYQAKKRCSTRIA